jgi:hypothetical protein
MAVSATAESRWSCEQQAGEVAMERLAIRTVVAGLREIGTDGVAVDA